MIAPRRRTVMRGPGIIPGRPTAHGARMAASRLTRILFALSDMAAITLSLVAGAAAISLPFNAELAGNVTRDGALMPVWVAITLFVASALGAFLLTRRNAVGLLLAPAPVALAFASGRMGLGVAMLAAALVVFGLPLLRALMEARGRDDA